MNLKKIGLLLAITTAFVSCKKEPGEGGKATVKGKITGTYICEDNNLVVEKVVNVPDERVYISYGATGEIDDDVRTASDGSYKFEFLQPGKYSIHTYTECSNCVTGIEEVVQEIEVGKKDEEVAVDDFAITFYSGRVCETSAASGPGEGGGKVIKGKVTCVNINENDYDTIGVTGMADKRVYIIYGSGTQQNDDVRTSIDGSFEFTNLNAGSYQVYVMSECRTLQCPSGNKAVLKTVNVTATDSVVDAGEFVSLDFRNP